MTYRPGDVTEKGFIALLDGTYLAVGTVYVDFKQALKAYRFGWRIIAARCVGDGKCLFVIRRLNIITTEG